MEAGEIIEAGTYQELMNLGGQYSQMYTAQSQLYTKA
jgi:ABC-type multidrug transport system fused ATPase/permease subunit